MKTRESNRLTILAADIQAAHREVQASAEKMAERAIAAGHMLIEAKGTLPHGKWRSWLDQHVGMSERSAQRYMQLARSGMKSATVAVLGIAGAAQAIAKTADIHVVRPPLSLGEEKAYQAWAMEMQTIIAAVPQEVRSALLYKPEVQLVLTRSALLRYEHLPASRITKLVEDLITLPERWPLAIVLLMESWSSAAEVKQ